MENIDKYHQTVNNFNVKVNDEEVNALTVKEDEGYITKIINKIKKLFKK